MDTSTLALAYFVGYQHSEARSSVAAEPAKLREVVEAFSQAVAARKVNRAAFRAFAGGWRNAEGMSA